MIGDKEYDEAIEAARAAMVADQNDAEVFIYADFDALAKTAVEAARFKLCDYQATQVADAIAESTQDIDWCESVEIVLQRITAYFGVADEDLAQAHEEAALRHAAKRVQS